MIEIFHIDEFSLNFLYLFIIEQKKYNEMSLQETVKKIFWLDCPRELRLMNCYASLSFLVPMKFFCFSLEIII